MKHLHPIHTVHGIYPSSGGAYVTVAYVRLGNCSISNFNPITDVPASSYTPPKLPLGSAP